MRTSVLDTTAMLLFPSAGVVDYGSLNLTPLPRQELPAALSAKRQLPATQKYDFDVCRDVNVVLYTVIDIHCKQAYCNHDGLH